MNRWNRSLIIGVVGVLGWSPLVSAVADPSFSSSKYMVIESDLGAPGDATGGSSHFFFVPGTDDGGSTLGDFASGNSSSSAYQINSGFNTTAQPGLTMIVNTSLVDFGNVSVATKTTRTATFSVIDYTSYGYVTQVIGTPPTMGSKTLTALTTDTAYSAAAEQFGINMVLNTASAVGANPVQNPAGPPTFGYGIAGDGVHSWYTVSDQWRFNSGETIASAPKSSGETDYTITFMMNATNTTPGGLYTGNITLVTTGTY